MNPFLIFGALYAFAGLVLAVLLNLLLPYTSFSVALLYGLLAFLGASVCHLFFIAMDKARQMEQRLIQLKVDAGELRDQTKQILQDLRDMASGQGTQQLDTVLSEVRIMQSVIDKVLQSEARDSEPLPPDQLPENMTDAQVLETVREAIRADRIEIFLQPIVSLPQRKLRFYELFSRIRTTGGGTLTPDRYIRLANAYDAGIVSALDNLQLLRCIQMLRDSEKRSSSTRFFCNIASSTLRDNVFMTELVQFLGQNMALVPKLVFELAQSDLATISADIFPLLDGLARLGCRFSMDRVYSLDFPLTALQARKIRFIKVDADFLIDQLNNNGERALRELKTALDRNSIDLICSKIEGENQLLEVLDLNIDFGQGYLFGEPRADWPLN